MSLNNWGRNYTPPSGICYECNNPICEDIDPPTDRDIKADGLYWFNTTNNKSWFNYDGNWVKYYPS